MPCQPAWTCSAGRALPEALAGADVLVNLTNRPTFGDASPAFFQTTMDNLLAAAEAAVIAKTAYRDWLARQRRHFLHNNPQSQRRFLNADAAREA